MNRCLEPVDVRAFFAGEGELSEKVGRLLAWLDALEEDPEAYGFEFVTDDPYVGREGQRTYYYAFAYPVAKLPEGCSVRPYLLGVEDDGGEYVIGIRAIIYDDQGAEVADSYDNHTTDRFRTCAEAVAWLNTQLGGDIIKREAPNA
jgi:hypothetical protein